MEALAIRIMDTTPGNICALFESVGSKKEMLYILGMVIPVTAIATLDKVQIFFTLR